MKHLAFFMPTLGGGGAERVMLSLARGAADRGCRVSLIVASANGSLVGEVPRDVELIDLNSRRVANSLLPLAKWLWRNHPDTLISSQGHANVVSYVANKLSLQKTNLLVREESTPSANLRHFSRLKALCWRTLLRYVYTRAAGVIAVSHGVAIDLEAYLCCNIPRLHVLYNPILNEDLYAKSKLPVSHRWFTQSDMPVVLAVGRLTRAKNFELLIRAFALVKKNVPARLLILGEGEDRAKLEDLVSEIGVSDSVEMPGFDPNPFRYMANCAVYVMSSSWEGLPGALVEALALSRNVVSTDCPSGPNEILAGGKFGKLVPVGDLEALQVAILSALSDSNSTSQVFLKKHLTEFEESTVFTKLLAIV